MSNSIWKMPDQKPDEDKKEFNFFPRQVVACHISSYGIEWGVAPVCLYSPTVKIEKWCYIDDLVAQADKAERLQKAVVLALERFDDIRRLYDKYYDKYSVIATETTEEIKHIIKEN